MATDTDQQKKDRKDQKIVLTNIFFGCVLLFCFAVLAAYYPFPKPRLPTLLDRIVFTLRWLIVSLFTVFAGIIWVANTRFRTSAINPLNQSGAKYVEISSRYLQNTVEQFLLHAFSLVVLATYLSEENMLLVPLLVVIFSIARLSSQWVTPLSLTREDWGLSWHFTQQLWSLHFVCIVCLSLKTDLRVSMPRWRRQETQNPLIPHYCLELYWYGKPFYIRKALIPQKKRWIPKIT